MNNKVILIVEDEPKIIEFIESYLINSGYLVEIAKTGREALRIYNTKKIDMILLDLMLPDISGETICKKIRETSDIPIIMITAKIEEDNIINGLNIGADDYITKPFSPRQLIARIKTLFRRTKIKGNPDISILTYGSLVINLETFEVTFENQPINFTPNEFKILATLAQRPKKVFTRQELIDIAFNGQYEGYARTIDSHIKNIRAKLSSTMSNNSYIFTVRGIGYKFGCE